MMRGPGSTWQVSQAWKLYLSSPGVQDKVLPRLEVLPVYMHLLQLTVLHQALKHLRSDQVVIDTSILPLHYLDPVLG